VFKQALPLLALPLLASTAAAEGKAFVEENGVWHRSHDGCGTVQAPVITRDRALPPPPAVGLRTIFLNRFGGKYKAGATNSATNTSQLVEGADITIAPMNTSVFDWNMISACVRNHFKPFNFRIVETEPNAGQYIEAVVGGDGTELGFGANQLFGIASADNFCNVTERGIAFSFSETHTQVPRRNEELCATIAHEVGHLVALEHEQLPQDLLSYVLIADSNTKAFVNQTSGCGTTPQDANPCTCSQTSTNSAMRLQQFVGARDTETTPPALEVTAPGGPRVPPAFDVIATATDNGIMSDVVVLVDGTEVGNDFVPDGTTYTISVRGVTDGDHTLTVVATDAALNETRKEIQITVQRSATGEDCTENDACVGGLCAQTPDGNFCTQTCNPDVADACPSGSTAPWPAARISAPPPRAVVAARRARAGRKPRCCSAWASPRWSSVAAAVASRPGWEICRGSRPTVNRQRRRSRDRAQYDGACTAQPVVLNIRPTGRRAPRTRPRS
jgi:hypothetical protein